MFISPSFLVFKDSICILIIVKSCSFRILVIAWSCRGPAFIVSREADKEFQGLLTTSIHNVSVFSEFPGILTTPDRFIIVQGIIRRKMGEMPSFQLGVIGALFLSVASSVSIVICNKALMSNLGFPFATTLTSWHLMVTFCTLHAAQRLNLFESKSIDMKTVILFGILNGVSIGLLNLSLGFNSIGFYQMTKLAIIPFTVLLETLFLKKQFSQKIKLSLFVLLAGVGIASVTDLQLNFVGTVLSLLAIITTCVGQILTSTIQKRLNVSSTQLLYQSAPFQAAILFVSGPSSRPIPHQKERLCTQIFFSSPGVHHPFMHHICVRELQHIHGYRQDLTMRNIIGILVAIFGMGLYSYFCVQENKKKQSVDLSLASQMKDRDSTPIVSMQDKEISHEARKSTKNSLV
ncbi:hypothetical protein OIU77_020576 [Salix suchowensis]|uniref:Sugar phosphate transporter domain-containing protein n=1 Tax=Salix suchowensis TaxID=1278906 RepID=A0ABQ9C6W8_9ROSI|nr:hypothetical protein OIU77_020576 [Salix suchowensis]